MAIRYQASEQVDDEVDRASMARMLNLRDVFELVKDAFDDRTFPEQELVGERYQLVGHVAFAVRD